MNESVKNMRYARGLSLVELLVSIGVIGILIGILLPSMSRVRAAAGAAKSLSNLHGLGETMHLYSASHDGFVPFFTLRDCLYGAPPDELGPNASCVRTNVWNITRMWPALMHDVAPWREHFESWLSPGHGRHPPYWPVPIGLGFRFVSYDYSRSFVASPRVWSAGSGASNSDIRPVRASEVRFPSGKVIMYDAERNYVHSLSSTTRRPVLMVDGSASLRLDSAATAPVQNQLLRTARPTIYHDTPNGVQGRDF